jgi:hypothetical protein
MDLVLSVVVSLKDVLEMGTDTKQGAGELEQKQ